MTLFLIGYAIAGAALYKASREGGEAKQFGYFLAFPFHCVAVPAVIALGTGLRDLLNTNGFWALLLVGIAAFLCLDKETRADPYSAFLGALICIGILKFFHACLKEMLGI